MKALTLWHSVSELLFNLVSFSVHIWQIAQHLVLALPRQMAKATEYLEQELANVRTGRASAGTASCLLTWRLHARWCQQCTGLLDHIKVQVYGQNMPLKAAANVSVRDAQTIVVTAFDPSVGHNLTVLAQSVEHCRSLLYLSYS